MHINEPDSELEKEILKRMCVDAAEGIKLQCGREYGFSEIKPRATQLDKLTPAELLGLPTNNLDTERDLSKFSRLSEVAKFRNNKFSAKGIRNDMTLYQSKKGEVQSIARNITKVLEKREKVWNENQKQLLVIRIKEKFEKSIDQKDYTKKLLQTCKTWGGPCTTAEELQSILIAKPDIQERIVKVELTYYRTTHKTDMLSRPDLFRLNKITHEERLENLLILLSDDDMATGSLADLPTCRCLCNSSREFGSRSTSKFNSRFKYK